MVLFACDYQEGCAPEILARLSATNREQTVGYSEDAYSERARYLIREAIACPEAAVHFLVGGTQTNTVVIQYMLRPHQGVLCVDTGHINVHESGAIEHNGHKVLPLASNDGLITATQVREALWAHYHDPNYEHMVQPGMVYISFPSELGSLYSRRELEAIYAVCREYDVPLFIDGARLGYGLVSPACDITWVDLPHLCDAFYIGGTKQGALFGEALVIVNKRFHKDFRYFIKQGGGLLAKGRLLGIQFETLFTDNLYLRLAHHAVDEALRIREALLAKGYALYRESFTNQQFVIFEDSKLAQLEKHFMFSFWEKTDASHTAVRICTSWATRSEDVDSLIEML